ncbi:MAG: redoxin domain-containing protein, partial [Vampirovibrio sp.]|nr:redoxin domain-containing protein [Vampirovibrio sp.]
LPLGTSAPLFELPDQNGELLSLTELTKNHFVVLSFYMKDNGASCMAMMEAFMDDIDAFQELNACFVAINPESVESHHEFCEQVVKYRVRLLSDVDKSVSKAYKALVFGGFAIDRTVYVIDQQGVIQYAKRGMPDVNEILSVLRKIKPYAYS